MSAKNAATALLELDTGLAVFAAQVSDRGHFSGKREVVETYLRENVMNTWALALAARSAGCSEQQIIAALMSLDPLRIGTVVVARDRAAELFA